MTTPTAKRIRVTAALKRKNYPHLLMRAHAIYNGMAGTPALFPSPIPSMAGLLPLLTAFDTAQQATLTKAKGTTQTRNLTALPLITALESEVTYIQGLCDESPEQALKLIAAAGMVAVNSPSHAKAILQTKLVPAIPGTALLVANATLLVNGSKKRPTFNWQSSIDGGKTIVNLPSTPHADTEVANLPLLTTVAFRVSVTLGKVTGEWSQWVTLFVH